MTGSKRGVEKELANRREEHSGVWYLAEYELAAGESDATKALEVKDFPGLVLAHSLDPKDGRVRLSTFWVDRNSFEASRAPLEELLKGAPVTTVGFLRRLAFRKLPLWKRFTLYAVLLHVAAVLGALAAIEKHYAALFEPPDLAIAFLPETPDRFLEGESVSIEVRVRNHSAVDTKLLVPTARLWKVNGEQAPTRVAMEIPSPTPVPAADEKPLSFNSRGHGRGSYRVEVCSKAKSGRLRPARQFCTPEPLSVSVWPRAAEIERVLEVAEPGRAKVAATLRTGEEWLSGAYCQAVLLRYPGIRFGPLRFPGLLSYEDEQITEPGREMADLTWKTEPLEPLREVPFSLVLEAEREPDWSAIMEDLELVCSKGETEDTEVSR